MKHFTTLMVAVLLASVLFAQTTETVSTEAGYTNEVYYTLNDGNTVSIASNDWDLGFASDGVGFGSSAIKVNDGTGVELYLFSTDTNDWALVDTVGFDWAGFRLVSSDESWGTGAFANTPPIDDFDLGWGEYSTLTHIVTGDRVFVIKLANESYRKLIIERLQSGVYYFRYANLDGSGLVSTSISKSNYGGKNFGYYSLENGAALDREPETTTWDLLFTKYVTDVGGGQLYGVSGVLANVNVQTAQVDNSADVNTEHYYGLDYSFNIGEIGSDWKEFNMSTFQYDIVADRVYFVQDNVGDIYRIIFTGFGGSANGNFGFTKELVGNVGVKEALANNAIVDIYPNPATDIITVVYTTTDRSGTISLFDMNGRKVLAESTSTSGLQTRPIALNTVTSGIYFLSISSENGRVVKKVVIQ
jgi:hypothetical protein